MVVLSELLRRSRLQQPNCAREVDQGLLDSSEIKAGISRSPLGCLAEFEPGCDR